MIYDLTFTIKEGMHVFPGTGEPSLSACNTMEEHGFRETMFHMTSHTGTHVDAPSHLLADGAILDTYPVDFFVGTAVLVDCRQCGGGRTVTKEYLQRYEEQLRQANFVLFRTGFEDLWEKPEYIGDYAVPTVEAAEYLVSMNIRGTATDAISIDPLEDKALANHKTLLGSGAVCMASLKLGALEDGKVYQFMALPVKYENSDGAPIRAIAID